MLIETDNRTLETSGNFSSSSFQIAASPKAFSILSSQLYSNKPLAIVRELSANAADAHTLVKNPDPFRIDFPSSLDANFRIRDFGPGLSEEGILTLYTTYFGSNKTHSNELIGGLGLGSKSPFAYTDQFTIHSYHGGKKSSYLAYIDQSSIPCVSKINEEDTDEKTGLEVVVPVKPADFGSFSSEAHILRYFSPTPVVSGAAVQAPKYLHTYDLGDVRISLREDRSGQARIIMGSIPYPINVSNIWNEVEHYGVFQMAIDIFMPVGSCEVAASREELSYNKLSIQNLNKLANKLVEELQKQLEAALDDADNLLTAFQIAQSTGKMLRNQIGRSFQTKREWGNHTLEIGSSFQLVIPKGITIRRISPHHSWSASKNWVSYLYTDHIYLDPDITDVTIFQREKAGPFMAYFDEMVAKDPSLRQSNKQFWIVEGPTADVEQFLESYDITTSTAFPKVDVRANPNKKKKANLGKHQYSVDFTITGKDGWTSQRLGANDILDLDTDILVYIRDEGYNEYAYETFRHYGALLTSHPAIAFVTVPKAHSRVVKAFKETTSTDAHQLLLQLLDQTKFESHIQRVRHVKAVRDFTTRLREDQYNVVIPNEPMQKDLYALCAHKGMPKEVMDLLNKVYFKTADKLLPADPDAICTEVNLCTHETLLDRLSKSKKFVEQFPALDDLSALELSHYEEYEQSLTVLTNTLPLLFNKGFMRYLTSDLTYYYHRNTTRLDSDKRALVSHYLDAIIPTIITNSSTTTTDTEEHDERTPEAA